MGFTIKNFEDNDDVEMSRVHKRFKLYSRGGTAKVLHVSDGCFEETAPV